MKLIFLSRVKIVLLRMYHLSMISYEKAFTLYYAISISIHHLFLQEYRLWFKILLKR